jgi:hypothetical protein
MAGIGLLAVARHDMGRRVDRIVSRGHGEFGATILRPGRLIALIHEREFLPERGDLEPGSGETLLREEIDDRLRTAVSESHVVLGRAALVRMTVDPELNLRRRAKDPDLLRQDLASVGAEGGLIIIEVDTVRENRTGLRNAAQTLGLCGGGGGGLCGAVIRSRSCGGRGRRRRGRGSRRLLSPACGEARGQCEHGEDEKTAIIHGNSFLF